MRVILDERPIDDLYPPATRSFPDPPRTRWSRRRRIAATAAAGLILVLAGGGVWWNKAVTGDPGLEFQNAASNVFRAAGDKTGITEIDNAVGEEARVHYEPGGRFSAWIRLYNGGPRDLRVEEIPSTGLYFFGVEAVVGDDDPNVAFPEGDEPLGPFTLQAGDSRDLRVDFRVADCDPSGLNDGSFGISSLPVRYRTLGFTRTVAVPFDDAAITLDVWGACDRPIPD